MIVNTKYGVFHTHENDLITDQLKKYSAHTRNELAMVLDVIKAGDIVLDIGSHIGTYSIPIALKLQEGEGKLYAFEANQKNYNLLVKNIKQNNLTEHIVPNNVLLSGSKGQRYSGIGKENNSGGNYFVPSVLKYQSQLSIRLSEYLESELIEMIDFIKIDIEGMEVLVLQDISKIIEQTKPILYIEVCHDHLERYNTSYKDLDAILKPIGYNYYVNSYLRNSVEDKYIIQRIEDLRFKDFFDVLAIPDESMDIIGLRE